MAAGQFEAIVADGSVYICNLYPFAVRNMRYVVTQLDEDGDGWPRVSATSSRPAWATRSSTTRSTRSAASTTWRISRAPRNDDMYEWAHEQARNLAKRFEAAWWYEPEDQYADSLINPGDAQSFQRHWIGQTPMEAELPLREQASPGLATFAHGAPVDRLRIGHTLPRGASVAAVYLDGEGCGSQARSTNRGLELTVKTRPGRHVPEIVTR